MQRKSWRDIERLALTDPTVAAFVNWQKAGLGVPQVEALCSLVCALVEDKRAFKRLAANGEKPSMRLADAALSQPGKGG